MSKPIRIDPMGSIRRRRVWLAVDGRQPHLPHQSTHALAADFISLAPQVTGHLPRPIPGRGQKLFVDTAHHLPVEGTLPLRRVVIGGSRKGNQGALAHDREPGMIRIDHRYPSVAAQRPKARDKKSFSTVSCPILACSALTSASWSAAREEVLRANTSGRLSRACRFHCAITLGCR